MITVGRFSSLEQAMTAKLALGASGIDAFIPDEMSASVAPMFFVNKPGVRLQVAEEDEEAAKEILEDDGIDEEESSESD